MNRIVCVGNRYADVDCVGPRVFDRLAAQKLPLGVELVDGGLAGLDLLGFVEGMQRVLFVDSLAGFAPAGTVMQLAPEQAAQGASRSLDHAAGLAYALKMIPLACDRPPRELAVVGVEEPATDASVDQAAALCVAWAAGAAPDESEDAGGTA